MSKDFIMLYRIAILFALSGLAYAESISPLADPAMWEPAGGQWEIHDGEASQTAQEEGASFRLIWKGDLPEEPFYLSFEILNDESLKGDHHKQAFVVVRSDSTGESGQGFGLNNPANRRNISWMEYPGMVRMNLGRDKTAWWNDPWHSFGLAVDGPSYELYYDSSKKSNPPSNSMLMRGYTWNHINQRKLVLRTEGTPARFRGLKITPLSQMTPPVRFKIAWPLENTKVERTRPVLKWEFVEKDDDRREDFDYAVTLIGPNGKQRFQDVTQELEWQPAQPLLPGSYRWNVEAKTFYGTVWGGKIQGTFQVSNTATQEMASIQCVGPKPQHFASPRPRLTWKWRQGVNVDQVDLSLNGKTVSNGLVLTNGRLTWTPSQDLPKGLNRLALTFMQGNEEVETVQTIAVRSRIPDQYSLRQDGVMLCNDTPVVPIGAYRDPSETLTDLTGTVEAGFNLTHSYRFEGGHSNKGKTIDTAELDILISDARDYLALCASKGVKVFLGIRRSWVAAGRLDLIEEYVGALMGEPALLTWYLYDEPDWVGLPTSNVRRAYNAIKSVDPYHLVSLCYAHQPLIPRLVRSSDILWYQAYGIPKESLADTIDILDKMRTARAHSAGFAEFIPGNTPVPKAVWCIPQAFDEGLWYKKRKASDGPHRPTEQEVVAQAYVAMIGQACGIVYYWTPPRENYNMVKDYPDVWKGLTRTGKVLNTVFGSLLREGEELDVPSHETGIQARARRLRDNKIVLVLVNALAGEPDGEKVSWRWSLDNNKITNVNKLCGKGQWRIEGNTIIVNLRPLEGLALELEVEPSHDKKK